MEEKSLLEYLNDKKNELTKLGSEISFLESIKIPLTVRVYSDGYVLISEDYSLATNFKIKDRTDLRSSFSCYDGGMDTILHKFYPQFYFEIKKGEEYVTIPVQHEGFDNDENIVIKSCNITRGWGDYRNEFRNEQNYVNTQKVISFFKSKGVKDILLKNLEVKIENFYDWVKL